MAKRAKLDLTNGANVEDKKASSFSVSVEAQSVVKEDDKAKETDKARIQQRKAKVLFGLRPHDTYPEGNRFRRSFTIAALIVSGYIRLTPTGGVSAGNGSLSDFRLITCGKASRVWTNSMLEDGSFLAKTRQAMAGKASAGYNGDLDTIRKFVSAIRKGGLVTMNDKGTLRKAMLFQISGMDD